MTRPSPAPARCWSTWRASPRRSPGGKEAGTPVEALYETVPTRGIEAFPGAPQWFADQMASFHRPNILMAYRRPEGAPAVNAGGAAGLRIGDER